MADDLRRRAGALLGIPPDVQTRWRTLDARPEPGPREILFHGAIVPREMDWFGGEGIHAAAIREQLAAARGDVVVRIHSPGGDIWEASAIQVVLRDHRRAGHRVDAIIDGLCASAATLVLLEASDVAAAPLADVMIHAPRACMCGGAADLAAAAEWLHTKTAELAAQYARRMNCSAKDVTAILDAGERWYSAAEAVEAGLVDRIIDPVDAAPPAAVTAAMRRRNLVMSLAPAA